MNALTAEKIKRFLGQARAPRWKKANVPDILAKSGHYVDSGGVEDGRRLWRLTPTGEEYIKKLLKLPKHVPEIEHDSAALDHLIDNMKDRDIKEYLFEAVKCLKVSALRASVVFLWSGAIRTIHNNMLDYNIDKLNKAIVKHDPKARNVKTINDFAYIKDKIVILAAQTLGMLDKSEKDTLQEALELRNRCGHPGKYRPGVKRVSGFIEDIISVVFS